MLPVPLIACDPVIGLPRVPQPYDHATVDDLREEMRRLRVTKALVRHRASMENAPYWGNRQLCEAIAGDDRLLPVCAVTPDGAEPDFDVSALVRGLVRSGVRMVWMRPDAHDFSPLPWCCGELYAALQEACLPLLVQYPVVPPDIIHQILQAFPRLRLLLVQVPRLGRNRQLYPLLQQHSNLMLAFDPHLSVHCGFRDLCDRFGPHRWVFGMGYPDAEGGAAITGLMYAGLDEDELQAVAHGNIERLLAEVRIDG